MNLKIKFNECKNKKQKEYGRHGIACGKYLFCFDDEKLNRKYAEKTRIMREIFYIILCYFSDCAISNKNPKNIDFVNYLAHKHFIKIIDENSEDFYFIFDYQFDIYIKKNCLKIVFYDNSKSTFSDEFVFYYQLVSFDRVIEEMRKNIQKIENENTENN